MKRQKHLSGHYSQVPFLKKVIFEDLKISRFYYKDLTMVPSVPAKSARYFKVSATRGIHYIDFYRICFAVIFATLRSI